MILMIASGEHRANFSCYTSRLAKRFNLEKTPFDILDKRLSNTKRALDESWKALSAAREEAILSGDLQKALVAVLGLDEISDLLDRDIDSAQIIMLLNDWDFVQLRYKMLCEIVLSETIIPTGIPLYLTEAEVKMKGEKWTVNKYDADPFPSNPHAHNYAQNLKLHLGNGDLYQHKDKVSCGRMQKKHLVTLRNLVMKKNATILLPPLAI
jgi:hypothetical protein